MAFDASLNLDGTVAEITLSGELDAKSAPTFRDVIESAADESVNCLVLLMQDLTYMASAGLRVLIFARQKMGSGVHIYIVGPHEEVRETLEMTGFHYSVTMMDEYDRDALDCD